MRRTLIGFMVGAVLTGGAAFPPALAGGEAGGSFWVFCEITEPERAIDPIVSPGQVSAHNHVFAGARVKRTDTSATLRERAFTTCSAPTDFSGYWVPTFYDADGTLITPDDVSVYYVGKGDFTYVPFPQDFGRVSQEVVYTCGRGTPRSDAFRPCPAPTSPRMIVIFRPGPGDRNFPETRINIRWTSQVGADPTTWVASSDPMGSPRHGDFLNGWIRRDLRFLIDKCINTPRVGGCGKITAKDFR